LVRFKVKWDKVSKYYFSFCSYFYILLSLWLYYLVTFFIYLRYNYSQIERKGCVRTCKGTCDGGKRLWIVVDCQKAQSYALCQTGNLVNILVFVFSSRLSIKFRFCNIQLFSRTIFLSTWKDFIQGAYTSPQYLIQCLMASPSFSDNVINQVI